MLANTLRLGFGTLVGLLGFVTISAVSAVAARSGPLRVQSDLRPAIAADYSAGGDEFVLQPLLPTILEAIEADEARFVPPAGSGARDAPGVAARDPSDESPALEGSAAPGRPSTPPARGAVPPPTGIPSGEQPGSATPVYVPPLEATPTLQPTPSTAPTPESTPAPAAPEATPDATAPSGTSGTGGDGTSSGGASGGSGASGGGSSAGGGGGAAGGNSNAGEQGGNSDDGGAGNSGGNGGNGGGGAGNGGGGG